MSPFCVLATSGADGSVDASPRGGNPGFIHVAGPNLLLMPEGRRQPAPPTSARLAPGP
jgi:predicted pyridoxine 5'-phosphate oxidase superfamily flavin-nucleotide-binding protein